MYIKSLELLPVDQQVVDESVDDEEDPRLELIRHLVAYTIFKVAAARLAVREREQESIFPRLPVRPEFEPEPVAPRADASLFDLLNALNAVLKRIPQREDMRDIFEDKWTVSEKIEDIRQRVLRQPRFRFSELFADATSRSEVVVTFLALLELIRLKLVSAIQSDQFGEIDIRRGESTAAETVSEPATAPSH
jgi:segregation and condensation protein A